MLSLIITVASAAAALTFYTFTAAEKDMLVYIQAVLCALIPIVFMFFKKKIPEILAVTAAVYIVLASNFGTTLSFYRRFASWDLIMHGAFGLVAALWLYVLLGGNLKFLSVQFLAVMGGAALWECFEYISDLVLGGDTQRVKESMLLGISPVKDTMTDILITALGAFIFYIGLYIYKIFKNKKSSAVHNNIKHRKEEDYEKRSEF